MTYYVLPWLAAVLMLTGCAGPPKPRHITAEPFTNEYVLILDRGEHDVVLSYWKKGVNWHRYQKAIIEPVTARKSAGSALANTTHAKTEELKELLYYHLQEALKPHFMLVKRPGPDTLLVQFAVTDAETAMALLNTFTPLYPSTDIFSAIKSAVVGTASYSGKASIEGHILDGETGELLMATADARTGGKLIMGVFDEWGEVDRAFGYWGRQLGYQICKHLNPGLCEAPSEVKD